MRKNDQLRLIFQNALKLNLNISKLFTLLIIYISKVSRTKEEKWEVDKYFTLDGIQKWFNQVYLNMKNSISFVRIFEYHNRRIHRDLFSQLGVQSCYPSLGSPEEQAGLQTTIRTHIQQRWFKMDSKNHIS